MWRMSAASNTSMAGAGTLSMSSRHAANNTASSSTSQLMSSPPASVNRASHLPELALRAAALIPIWAPVTPEENQERHGAARLKPSGSLRRCGARAWGQHHQPGPRRCRHGERPDHPVIARGVES